MDKVFTPATIPETPFPFQDQTVQATVSQTSSNATYGQATTQDQYSPTQRIAVDVLSSVLNTKTRKIIREFQFTSTGAMQIGDYKNGQAGDIRISPDGIVARDVSGNTTFALDGDTGDATFAGELQSGAVVTGQVAVGNDAIQIDGLNRRIIFYDASGLPVILIGQA